jgi:hypothetical protein
MEINSNMNAGGINPLIPARRAVSGSSAKADRAGFASSAALDGALKQIPDVRPEAVDRARDLISDPDYPSADTVSKLSDFLAAKLTVSN